MTLEEYLSFESVSRFVWGQNDWANFRLRWACCARSNRLPACFSTARVRRRQNVLAHRVPADVDDVKVRAHCGVSSVAELRYLTKMRNCGGRHKSKACSRPPLGCRDPSAASNYLSHKRVVDGVIGGTPHRRRWSTSNAGTSRAIQTLSNSHRKLQPIRRYRKANPKT